MWLSLLCLLLLLAVTIVQATHGFFSALIMTVLTLCCGAAAIGMHEWVAQNWLIPLWRPDYAYALALIVLFGVPLVLLRLGFDLLIRRACLLPNWVDRLGGGFCGLITAFMVVGMAAFSVQNLPFGETVVGFARVDVPLRQQSGDEPAPKPPDPLAERNLWFSPDRFAVNAAALLSSGVFSGGEVFAQVFPDLVQSAGWTNAVHREVSRTAQAGSVNIVRTATVPFVYNFTQGDDRRNVQSNYEPVEPRSGHEFRMLRVSLLDGARDARRSHVFTLRQFRLVGRRGAEGMFHQAFPMAIQQADATQPTNRHIRAIQTQWGMWPVINDVFSPREGNNEQVEIVFELPTGFQPLFLEYKRGARTPVSFDMREPSRPGRGDAPQDTAEPEAAPSSSDPTAGAVPPPETAPDGRRRRRGADETVPTSGSGGRVRGATTRTGRSFFGDELPVSLKSYRAVRAPARERGRLSDGHLVGEVALQDEGSDAEITNFHVPSDKRLLQLNVARLRARSGLGRALETAVSTVQNFVVQDSNGNRYEMVGRWAIADVEGTQVVEVDYLVTEAGTPARLAPFERIKDHHLTGEYDLVLLFLVDPGAQIVSFSTGGAASRQDDLTEENLVAPL